MVAPQPMSLAKQARGSTTAGWAGAGAHTVPWGRVFLQGTCCLGAQVLNVYPGHLEIPAEPRALLKQQQNKHEIGFLS